MSCGSASEFSEVRYGRVGFSNPIIRTLQRRKGDDITSLVYSATITPPTPFHFTL